MASHDAPKTFAPRHNTTADIVIPVHTANRPIRRAVESVIIDNKRDARAIVVAHNIEAAIIRDRLGDYAEHDRVRLLHLQDGIHSPAGPLNHGISNSDATYYSVLGSDDLLEPGAVDSWIALAVAADADAVLARVHRTIAGPDLVPVRRRRVHNLHPVRDRLSYRCVPQGLVSRERFGHLRFTPGLASGEDLEFTAQLWLTGSRFVYDRHGPAYILDEDGDDRVTSVPRPVSEDFAFLDIVAETAWYPTTSATLRRA